MKTSSIILLFFVFVSSSAFAQKLPILTSTVDVVAGRNLRSQGTRFCSITVNNIRSYGKNTATAVILLPKNARLLDARVLSPTKTHAKCSKAKVLGNNSVVSCKLSRLSTSKSVILRARYHQKFPTRNSCTAYIQASNAY